MRTETIGHVKYDTRLKYVAIKLLANKSYAMKIQK